MKRKSIMLDFELKLEPIRELKRPPRKMKEGRVYLVSGTTTYVDVDETHRQFIRAPDVIYMLCPCGCEHPIRVEAKAPNNINTFNHLGLTITPWIYVPSCTTRFIVAHGTAYGQCLFPPKETMKTARKEIFLKFGK